MISEFPLFVFTTFAGMAAGAYAVNAAIPVRGEDAKREWLFPVVLIVLLAVGMVGSLMHLGRPALVLNALSNPSSMICQEAYWSAGLGVFLLVDAIVSGVRGSSPRAIQVVGGVCGVVLTCVMGYAYFTSYGNPAWAAWPTLLLFIGGNLAMGAAIAGAFGRGMYGKAGFVATLVVVEAVLAVGVAGVISVFAGLERDVVAFVAGLVIAPVASIVSVLALRAKQPSWLPALVAVLTVVGVAIARYAFYAASII